MVFCYNLHNQHLLIKHINYLSSFSFPQLEVLTNAHVQNMLCYQKHFYRKVQLKRTFLALNFKMYENDLTRGCIPICLNRNLQSASSRTYLNLCLNLELEFKLKSAKYKKIFSGQNSHSCHVCCNIPRVVTFLLPSFQTKSKNVMRTDL